jgi:hypothetical protein
LQQGFGQAQQARQQDIANRFGLGQAQAGIASQTQGLGAFPDLDLAGQQAQLGAQTQAGVLGGTDISTFRFIGRDSIRRNDKLKLDATKRSGKTGYIPTARTVR